MTSRFQFSAMGSQGVALDQRLQHLLRTCENTMLRPSRISYKLSRWQWCSLKTENHSEPVSQPQAGEGGEGWTNEDNGGSETAGGKKRRTLISSIVQVLFFQNPIIHCCCLVQFPSFCVTFKKKKQKTPHNLAWNGIWVWWVPLRRTREIPMWVSAVYANCQDS